MFKKLFNLTCFLVPFLVIPLHSQGQIGKSKADTGSLQKFIQLGLKLINSNSDSAMYFAQKGLLIAQQLEKKEEEAKCLSIIGNILTLHQNYPAALQANIKSLQIREDMENDVGVGKSYVNIGLVYTEMNDYQHALNNHFKAKRIFEKLITANESIKKLTEHQRRELATYKKFLGVTLLNIGDAYDRWGKLDSAIMYQKEANFLAEHAKDSTAISYTFINLGSIYAKLGNHPFAISHYKESLPFLISQDDRQSLSTAYHGLGEVYLKNNNLDSSFYYAKKSLEYASNNDYKKEKYIADTLLSLLYKKKGKNDSALRYYELARDVASSLDAERQSIAVQNMKLNETFRQTERARLQTLKNEKESYNLQISGIAIFIVTFFGVLYVLSKRRTKHKSYKFMGLIGLFLLFEFFMYVIHPYISNLTHHTPVYILIITVGIAALIAPLHHRVEHWIENRLGLSNEKPNPPPTDVQFINSQPVAVAKPKHLNKEKKHHSKKRHVARKIKVS